MRTIFPSVYSFFIRSTQFSQQSEEVSRWIEYKRDILSQNSKVKLELKQNSKIREVYAKQDSVTFLILSGRFDMYVFFGTCEEL